MSKKLLVFAGGLHGNFLIRSVAVASGLVEKFDFWKETLGAHGDTDEFLNFSENILSADIIALDQINYSKKIDFFILIDKNSLYRRLHHLNIAGGRRGTNFNLLNLTENYNDNVFYTKNFVDSRYISHTVISKILNTDSINSMRDILKISLAPEYIEKHDSFINTNKVENVLLFNDFYDYKLFDNMVSLILNYLNLNYTTDISSIYKIFYNKKAEIINSESKVKNLFYNYLVKGKNNIFDLTLYEQAYFDYLTETYYNINIDINYEKNKYPVDIKSYIEFHSLNQ